MSERGPGSIEDRYFETSDESLTSIDIPEHVLERIRKRKEEYSNPDLSFERWNELNTEHEKMMKGDSDDDLYYQLSVLQGMKDQPGEGVGLRRFEVERKIRERKEQQGNKE